MSGRPARIEIVPFTADCLPAVIRFSECTWNRPRSEAFYHWRYRQAPAQHLLLALRGEECVAMIESFLRDYRFGDERRTCREIQDWFCRPELRGSGLGVRLLQTLMKQPEPIVAIRGTSRTLALLPRLGWRKMTIVTHHFLPLGASAVADSLRRRLRIPAPVVRAAFALVGRRWFSPRAVAGPPGGEVRLVSAVGEEISPLYEGDTGYRVLPMPNFAHLSWLTEEFPDAGPFVRMQFRVRGELRGWTLFRVHGPEEWRRVTLVEAYAPRPDETMYRWMVSESLIRALEFRPLAIDTRTACPILRRALRRCRFLEMGSAPIHIWPADLPGASEPVHLVRNASDGALLPYPAGSPDGPVLRGT